MEEEQPISTSNFQYLTDILGQLEQDQSLFEALLGEDDLQRQAEKHEEIIKLGGEYIKKLNLFVAKGQVFAETLPPDFLLKHINCMNTYRDLIMPPKVFGGYCPCLKPSREGEEYEKKLLYTKSQLAACMFTCQSVVIEDQGEKHNMDSVHFMDYCNKMNVVMNALGNIKVVGSEKQLESARQTLVSALEDVYKFVDHYGDAKADFQSEANRRIKSTRDLLAPRQPNADGVVLPLSRRVLI